LPNTYYPEVQIDPYKKITKRTLVTFLMLNKNEHTPKFPHPVNTQADSYKKNKERNVKKRFRSKKTYDSPLNKKNLQIAKKKELQRRKY
jgi:hypothetical protein